VGVVTTRLHSSGEVTVQNVPAYRLLKDVELSVEGYGTVIGDVAWGGNWFFLTHHHGLEVSFGNLERLTDCAWKIRRALARQGITGAGGQDIDHVELFGPPTHPDAHGKNFVLCPGGAYDRSPCGTGTCAKVACLAADGILKEGEVWRQESIVGSVFEGSVQIVDGVIHPSIKGSAFVTAEARLLFDPRDPFVHGISPARLL
jgi:4-hydroxyproline epimerase